MIAQKTDIKPYVNGSGHDLMTFYTVKVTFIYFKRQFKIFTELCKFLLHLLGSLCNCLLLKDPN